MTVTTTESPAGSSAGKDLGAPRRLGHAPVVGGPDLELVQPGGGVPGPQPLPPGVDPVGGGQPGGVPGAVVHADLHRGDAGGGRPGHAGHRHAARGELGQRPGYVDPRLGVDRGHGRVAALGPVGALRGEGGHGQPGDPLGRGGVAVQAGHHHAGREPVRDGQRLAVHAHGQQRVPAVHDRGQRGGDRHAVNSTRQHLIGSRPDPGAAQQRGQRRAEPAGVARVRAADLVRDADQGDVGLGQRHLQQLGEGDLEFPVHHAVDPQRPGFRRDLGQHQVGVHPVEAGVRGEERGQARDPQVGARRDGRHGQRRRGQPHVRPGRGDAEPPQQHVAQAAGRRGQRRRARRAGQEPAAIRCSGRPGVLRVGDQSVGGRDWPGPAVLRVGDQSVGVQGEPAARFPGPDRPHQRDQGSGGHGHPGQGGHHVEQAGPGQPDRRRDAEAGEHRESGQPVADPAHRRRADQRGEPGQHDQDPGHQCLLVVRAEVRDREVLDRDGGQVDRRLADRDDRGAGRADERRRELGHAQRHRGGQYPGQRACRGAAERTDYGARLGVPILFPDHGRHSELSREPDWRDFHPRRPKTFGAIRRRVCLE